MLLTEKKLLLALIMVSLVTGCEKKPEDKPIKDLSADERQQVCRSDAVTDQVKSAFALHTAKLIADRPDNNFHYDVKEFKESFGKTALLTLTDAGASSSTDNMVRCEAKFSFTTDRTYGRVYENTLSYDIIKQDNRLVTTPVISLQNLRAKNAEPTPAQIAYKKQLDDRAEQAVAAIKAIPDSDFTPVSLSDLVYIYFAQAERTLPDETILDVFSNKWNNTTDSFAKDEIKKQELPQIKAKIASYKEVKNILVYSDSQRYTNKAGLPKTAAGEEAVQVSDRLSLLTSSSYDMDKQAFPYDNYHCNFIGGFSVSRQGVNLSLDRSLLPCNIPMPVDQAREVSAKLAAIAKQYKTIDSAASYYLHIDKVDNRNNTISTTLVRQDIVVKDPTSKDVIFQTRVK